MVHLLETVVLNKFIDLKLYGSSTNKQFDQKESNKQGLGERLGNTVFCSPEMPKVAGVLEKELITFQL